MSEIVEIECTPAFADSDLVAALAGRGISGRVVETGRLGDTGRLLTFHVGDDLPDLSRRVLAALDDAIAQCGAPLLSRRIGSGAYIVHPPAA